MDYRPVVIQKPTLPTQAKHSAESRFWRQFKHPIFVKEYAPVTSVNFSPTAPHRYAVTAATRVQIYSPRTQKIIKTISRFKDVARSGNIRPDGKLLVAGDDSGLIQIFDINSRAILRTLDGHKQPVHITKFSHLNHTQILSCSDDTTVRLWDVPSQSPITTFTDHTDYVRSGQFSATNPHLVLSGSYDGTVRMFDSRSGNCEMLMNSTLRSGNFHGSTPVEQVLMYPSGSIALSAAGSILRVWDLVAGGRCIRALSNHQKTVTSLTFNSNASKVLSGGLDHMVKVYDIASYDVVHTMRYPAPILCMGISPDDTHIAVGMSDGTLSIRRRQSKTLEHNVSSSSPFSSENLRAGAYEPFLNSFVHIGESSLNTKTKRTGDPGEFRIESKRKRRLKEYDKLLKSFKYTAALDSVLRKNIPPATTFALIQELIYRDGLQIALAGRDDVLLEPILRLLLKYVIDPRFGLMTCDIANAVLDMYAPVLGQSPIIDTLFVRLRKKVDAEIQFRAELSRVKGVLDMLFASNTLSMT